MKVIIVAMGRSGGYGLGEWIGLELNHTYYHEPIINNLIPFDENRVVKYLLNEWIQLDTKPEYDILIGLVRENIRECAISHVKAREIGNFRVKYTVNEEWLIENADNIQTEFVINQFVNEDVKKIQTDILISYEGIYEDGSDIEPMLELLNINTPKYLHLLSKSNRLRKTKENLKKQLI